MTTQSNEPEVSAQPAETPERAPLLSSTGPEDAPLKPLSMHVPGLGLGPEVQERKTTAAPPERKTASAPRERKATPSGRLLKELATPKVFPGPTIELQQKIVAALEAELSREVAPASDERKRAEPATPGGDGDEASRLASVRAGSRQGEAAPRLYYIGSIVLTEIPEGEGGDETLIKQASLVETDHALAPEENAAGLPAAAGVEREVIENTIRTMITAKQIDYLRQSGVVGGDWKVIIEIHYYRDRSTAPPYLHKDTRGQTMFVNLSYTNETPMAGPEWITNPPLIDEHEQQLQKTLPPAFLDDLAQTRSLPAPTTIETETLPPGGVVSFVDEAIHHATPQVGHREISAGSLKAFLQKDEDFTTHYEAALAAYQAWSKSCCWSFRSYFNVKLSRDEKDTWENLMGLCAKPRTTLLTRPDLEDAGMTAQQVDRAIWSTGRRALTTVGLEGTALAGGRSRDPGIVGADGKPLPLQRRMSQLAATNQLPPKQPPTAPRRFFRTWIRAVPVKSTEPGSTAPTGLGPTTPSLPVMKAEAPPSSDTGVPSQHS